MKKEQSAWINILLAGVVGLFCLVALLWRAFSPAAVLPEWDIPLMAALSLAALLLDGWLAPGARRTWGVMIPLACVTFGLLPWCAGLASRPVPALAVAGGVTFGVAAILFTSISRRLASGPAGKVAAPLLTALILFLAGQGLSGIFL